MPKEPLPTERDSITMELPKDNSFKKVLYVNDFLFSSPTLCSLITLYIKKLPGFPGGAVVENLPANAGDTGSSPGLGGSHMPRSN